MKIKHLEMTDFRQFAGRQSLDFAADPHQNVTIIMGQNGAGKTGIFRAILFALFGDTELNQDSENADVHLINETALREGQGGVAQAQVTLTFEHSGVIYKIKRGVRGRFDGRHYYQDSIENQQCELLITQPGQEPQVIHDRIIANQQIEAIIRRGIREFFFFDAESMQILSDLGKVNVRDRVRKGIFQLLQVQDLDNARQLLKSLHSRIERQVRTQLKDSKTQAQQQELERVETEITTHRNQIQALGEDIKKAKAELEQKESRYKDSTATRELNDKIQSLEDKKKQLDQTLAQRLINLSGLIKQGSTQLFSDLLPEMTQKVETLRNSSQDNIPKIVLKQSLEQGVCALCGHELSEDSHAQDHINELLRLFKYSQSASYLTSIEQSVAEVTQESSDYIQQQSKDLEDYFKDLSAFTDSSSRIDGLKNQLQASADEIAEIKGLAESIEHIKEDLLEKESNLKTQQLALPELEKHRDELNDSLTQSQTEDSKSQYLVRENKLLKDMEDSLTQILNDYSVESREQIESRTLGLFNKFIATKDRDLIAKVTIESDYQIQVTNSEGRDLTNDLSQGEKQILSLAFVMALAQVASEGRQEMAFPLFMDTPFARIDGDNRDRLISAIPEITGQWVLLLTDTELTSAERDEFVHQGSVGATYRLDNLDGQTTISSVQDLALLELRGENNG